MEFLQTKRVHAGETFGTETADMRCELSRRCMDAACGTISVGTRGEERYIHSGGTLVLSIGKNISKRYFSVVFVF